VGHSDVFSENTCDITWILLVVRLQDIHMTDGLGFTSVQGRNNVVDRTKLLFHDIGPIKLCLQRIVWNGKQNKDSVAWLERPLTRSAVIPAFCLRTLLRRMLRSNINRMSESLTGAKNELNNILFGTAQVCLL